MIPSPRRAAVLATVLALGAALFALAGVAQEAPPAQPAGEVPPPVNGSAPAPAVPDLDQLFFDTVEVNLANVEVLVTDRDGRPVTGLGKDDFEVEEDGREVTVSHFFGVENRRAVSSSGGADGSVVGEPTTKQLLLVVYLDLLTLRPEARNRVFESLRTYLHDELGEGDRVMLVTFDGRVEIVERFTHDVARLEASLDRLSKELTTRQHDDTARRRWILDLRRAGVPPRQDSAQAAQADFDIAEGEALRLLGQMRTFAQREYERVNAVAAGLARFCESLAGLRGRKAVLLVSQGLAERPGEELVRAWSEKYEQWATAYLAESVVREIPGLGLIPRNAAPIYRALEQSLAGHQVAVYPLSPPSRSDLFGRGAEHGAVVAAGGPTTFSPAIDAIESLGREQPLISLAEGTGGVAFTRSSNLAGLLERVEADFSHFYSLAYTPPRPADGQFHEVKVRVRGRPDLEVRHLKGYVQHAPLEQLRNVTVSALRYDIDDNPLGLAVSTGDAQTTVTDKVRVPILITLPFANLALLPQQGFFLGKVTAYVVAEQQDGDDSSGFQRIDIPIALPEAEAGRIPTGRTGTWVELLLKPGRQRVAVGVRDEIADVEAAVSVPVEVSVGDE